MRKEANLVNPISLEPLELDIWIPSLNLAFEYQVLSFHSIPRISFFLLQAFTFKEKHHYVSTSYAYQPLDVLQSRDKMKQQLATTQGITLVTVPCWWDGRTER